MANNMDVLDRKRKEEQQIESALKVEGVLQRLAAISGGKIGWDDIERSGTKIIIPENSTPEEIIDRLHEFNEAENELVDHHHNFASTTAADGVYAFWQVLCNVFGLSTHQGVMTFFGRLKPQYMSVETSYGQYTQIPVGPFKVSGFDGGVIHSIPHNGQFYLRAEVKKKYMPAVNGLIKLIEQYLEENSIYRGKAIDAGFKFLNLKDIKPEDVIYSETVRRNIEASIWAPITKSELVKAMGTPLKRTVLLEGPYGTGKSLTALVTALLAVQNGWTFIMCRPGADDLKSVFELAQKYEPAVVFAEDLNLDASTKQDGRTQAVETLLNTLDGITSKDNRLITVVTTNHVEQIHPAMLRPGRIDDVIHIGKLDEQAIIKLMKMYANVPLSQDFDWAPVVKEVEGFVPAYLREVMERVKLYSIAKNGTGEVHVDHVDVCSVAKSLRRQHDLMEEATRSKQNATPIDDTIKQVLGTVDRVNLLERALELLLDNRGIEMPKMEDLNKPKD